MATTSQNDNSAGDKHHSYSFTLVLSGFDDLTPELEHELFEVGCDDALLGIDAGTPYLTFDRQATSLEEAIKSAIKAVEALPAKGLPVEIVRVVLPDAEVIENFNAYLRVRRQMSGELAQAPPDVRRRIENFLAVMLDHKPASWANMLEK
jgi:hypothetical protein